MKRTTVLLIFLVFVIPLIAQQKENPEEMFYMLDWNFKSTSEKAAKYFIHVKKIKDSCWQFDTYNMLGTLMRSEQYKDEKGRCANGFFYYYKKNGFIDSSGEYINRYQNGNWYYCNNAGRAIAQKNYDLGKVVFEKELSNNASFKIIGDTSLIMQFPDSALITNEKPAEFYGGEKKWLNYLNQNINYKRSSDRHLPQGQVMVIFAIEENGKISEPRIYKSVEYTLDEEALRVIGKSPSWIPAVKDGANVKSYRIQSITFSIQRIF